jgi:hypothetical protein
MTGLRCTEEWYQNYLKEQGIKPLARATKAKVLPEVQSATVTNPPRPQATKKTKLRKYRNQKIEIGGKIFDSLKEGNHYNLLWHRERMGEITELETQRVFVLAPAVILDGRKKPPIRYRSDFSYKEKGALVVVDVKSPVTRKLGVYRLKKHLMASVLGLKITEI